MAAEDSERSNSSDPQLELGAEGFGSPVADRVHALLAPVIATLDVDLVDVQWSGGTLRLAVERLDGEDGITTDALAEVNRLVSPLLDQHDPVPGRYTLEVSSPGVERPLRRTEHFARAVGEVVIVKTIPGHDPRRLRGLLRAVADARLVIEVDEIDGVELRETETHEVAMADIASAKTHFEWGPTPKKGGKGANKNRPKKKQQKPTGQAGETATTTTTEEERGRT